MQFQTRIDRQRMNDRENLLLSEELGVSPVFSLLLRSRGVENAASARRWLEPDFASVPSPSLLPDMESAVSRITEAFQNRESILIYGDYDADGVTASSMLSIAFSALSPDSFIFAHIPDRFNEGYGLFEPVIEDYAKKGVSLIVTVDTGSKAHEQISYARSLGIDVVVTDHHECGETLPECTAVVNPMRKDSAYPFKGLAGVGVAFKLLCAIRQRLAGCSESEVCSAVLKEFSDLVALGTVADVMPLTDENRFYVKKGLSLIEEGVRVGIRALTDQTKSRKNGKITSASIGFQLAPRINAAGRMANGRIAFELLTTKDEFRAISLAEKLCALNEERQRIENNIVEEVYDMLSRCKEDDKVVLLAKKGWHRGVIGIAASKICETTGKPAILLSIEDGLAKGSGRSPEKVNLVSLLESCSDLLVQFGGHDQAAGLTVSEENADALRKRMNDLLSDLSFEAQGVCADIELLPGEADLRLAKEIGLLEPFGGGNETPLFLLRNMEVVGIFPLTEGKHTKVVLEREGFRFTTLFFGTRTESFPASANEKIDVVFTLSVNEFHGREELQPVVRAVLLSNEALKEREKTKDAFAKIENGFSPDVGDVPDVCDFKRLYVYLRKLVFSGKKTISTGHLISFVPEMTYMKLLICLNVFSELGLIRFRIEDSEKSILHVELSERENQGKCDLSSASLMRKIRENGAC